METVSVSRLKIIKVNVYIYKLVENLICGGKGSVVHFFIDHKMVGILKLYILSLYLNHCGLNNFELTVSQLKDTRYSLSTMFS